MNEAIRKVLSEALPTLKDPRIGFVTVTGVDTTTDLSQATVFVSVLGSEDEQERTLAGPAVGARRPAGAGRARARHAGGRPS